MVPRDMTSGEAKELDEPQQKTIEHLQQFFLNGKVKTSWQTVQPLLSRRH